MPNDGSCEGDLSCLVNVTVSVDMSVEGFTVGDGSTWDGLDGSSMAIRLNGGSWIAMTDIGDNVWCSHTFSDFLTAHMFIISMMVGMNQVHLATVLVVNMVTTVSYCK